MIFPIILFMMVLGAFDVEAGKDPKCPPRDGKYPVYIPHKDCTKFWQCSNGTPYLLRCPDKLYFNPKLNVCDWPYRAGCKSRGDNSGDSLSSESNSESTEN